MFITTSAGVSFAATYIGAFSLNHVRQFTT